MTDRYTPTTEQVRAEWPGRQESFDRWLRGKLAEAWDSAIYHVEPILSREDRRAAHADNPYREEGE